MSDTELLRRIEKAFGSVFGRKVPFHAALSRTDEARWTSLKHVEFVIALEREFDQRFDGADATDMTSIQAVLERIRHRCP